MRVVALRIHNLRIFQYSSNTYQEYAFVRSGYVSLIDGRAYRVGANAYGWSRVVDSAIYAYYLGVYPTNVGPSNSDYRWNAFPLRCLYQG